MKIDYFLHQAGNPLYNGGFEGPSHAYLSFGLHTFLYDLALSAIALGHHFTLFLDDQNNFPAKAQLLAKGISIRDLSASRDEPSDITIIDQLHSDEIHSCRPTGKVVGIVHNYLIPQSREFYSSCDKVISLTPWGAHVQGQFCSSILGGPIQKVSCVAQGLYLPRFVAHPRHRGNTVLFYSRMDETKGLIYAPMIAFFIDCGYDVSIMGAGCMYEEFKKTFAGVGNFHAIGHHHFTDIPRILDDFDIVVSNGRGIMEAMACGKTAIAAGVRYFGPILDINTARTGLDFNYTGWMPSLTMARESGLLEKYPYWEKWLGADPRSIQQRLDADLKSIKEYAGDPLAISAQHFDGTQFIVKMLSL